MTSLELIRPMDGCRLARWGPHVILFNQPPEVVKALVRCKITNIDTFVLPDIRERHGTLMNNLEFPLYFFLFVAQGIRDGRKLRLVGDATHLTQILTLLRLTLLGPNAQELRDYNVDDAVAEELLNESTFLALKTPSGEVRPVTSFFDLCPFQNNTANCGDFSIVRTAPDVFQLYPEGESDCAATVDLNDNGLDAKGAPKQTIDPPYAIQPDLFPSGLVQYGVDVLSSATGFSTEQGSTGMLICYNGNYLLVDTIPYLDRHLKARGISKNQITACFITHLHDDHCNMFPLLYSPHKMDVITTYEIFEMCIAKLSMGLGWEPGIIRGFFNFIEVKPGETYNYYGLRIETHYTVHSIPTVGATFTMNHRGHAHHIVVAADNQAFKHIHQMHEKRLISQQTVDTLTHLYTAPYDIFIADGGAGVIHGDPCDALDSKAERVIFVHVDKLPERFNATFTLAWSGKRFSVLDGEHDLYTMSAMRFLIQQAKKPLNPRWLSSLFSDKSIKKYNLGDVIIKQNGATRTGPTAQRGSVFLILCGYCSIVHHDGSHFSTIATREAGDFVGEMAIITGTHTRNASVIATTPVVLCEFADESFRDHIYEEQLSEGLIRTWTNRALLTSLPMFSTLNSTAIDILASIADSATLSPGESISLAEDGGYWIVILQGNAFYSTSPGAPASVLQPGDEAGPYIPYAPPGPRAICSIEGCTYLRFPVDKIQDILANVPQVKLVLLQRRIRQGYSAGILLSPHDTTVDDIPELTPYLDEPSVSFMAMAPLDNTPFTSPLLPSMQAFPVRDISAPTVPLTPPGMRPGEQQPPIALKDPQPAEDAPPAPAEPKASPPPPRSSSRPPSATPLSSRAPDSAQATRAARASSASRTARSTASSSSQRRSSTARRN